MHYLTAGDNRYNDPYPGQKSRSFKFSRSKDRIVMAKFDDYTKFFTLPGEEDYDVTFHPEGGYLIPGVPVPGSIQGSRG